MAETRFRFKMAGADAVRSNLQRETRKQKRALAASLYSNALDVIGNSVQRTPVKYGILRASAYAAPPMSIDDPSVEIGYGTNYAVPVHERTELRHPIGEAKFLEKSIDEKRSQWLQLVAARQQIFLETGVGLIALASTMPTRPRKESAVRQAVGKGVSRSRGLKGAARRRRRRRRA